MNRYFSLTWHLLKKDVRFQANEVLFLWVLALLIPSRPFAWLQIGLEGDDYIPTILFYLLGFLVLIRLIQLDPPGRVVHFLATRAVPWWALLSSKFLFVLLFLMFPMWASELLKVDAAGIPFSSRDTILFLAETGLEAAASLGLVSLFAVFCRRVSTVILALLAYLVANLAVVLTVIANRHESNWNAGPMAPILFITPTHLLSTILGTFFFVLMVIAVFLIRYRYRSLVPLFIFLIIGMGVASILSDLINSHNPFSASKEDRAFLDGLKPTFPTNTIYTTVFSSDLTVNLSLDLANFRPPFYANNLLLTEANATLRSGDIIESQIEQSPYTDRMPPVNLERHLVDMPSQFWVPLYPQEVPLLHFRPSDIPSGLNSVTKLSGKVSMEVYRAELLPVQIPLKSGASMACERRHYTLKNVKVTGNVVEFQLDTDSALLTLWGDDTTIVALVYNPQTGESLTPMGGSEQHYLQEYLSIQHSSATYQYTLTHILPPGAPETDMDELVAHAKVAFFAIHDLGTQTFPFEMTNVRLRPSAHHHP